MRHRHRKPKPDSHNIILDVPVFYQTIAETLRLYRQEIGITQKELSERSGLSQATIATIETRQGRPLLPAFENIVRGLIGQPPHIKPSTGYDYSAYIKIAKSDNHIHPIGLSTKTGITLDRLKRIDKGKVLPQVDDVYMIAKALNMTVEGLIGSTVPLSAFLPPSPIERQQQVIGTAEPRPPVNLISREEYLRRYREQHKK